MAKIPENKDLGGVEFKRSETNRNPENANQNVEKLPEREAKDKHILNQFPETEGDPRAEEVAHRPGQPVQPYPEADQIDRKKSA
jgi:hypothetical protein